MILDAFFKLKSPRARGYGDELDRLISLIESFAPKEFRKERLTQYYNYSTVDAYRIPLAGLLEILGKGRGSHEDAAFSREVFLKLRAFYDVKNSLSDAQALSDQALKRKFRYLFRYFYGKEGLWPSTI